MATALKDKIGNMSLGMVVYLVIGAVVTIGQDYWDFTAWDGHVVASLLTAVIMTVFWPVAIFYQIALIPR